MPLSLPDVPRILVTRTDRIGDLVLTLPAIQAVKEDGKFENVEMICMAIDMGGQSI